MQNLRCLNICYGKDLTTYLIITPLILPPSAFNKPTRCHKREVSPRPSPENGTHHRIPQSSPCASSSLLCSSSQAFPMSSSSASSYFTGSFHFISIYLLTLMMHTQIYKTPLLQVRRVKKTLKIHSCLQVTLLNSFWMAIFRPVSQSC